MTRWNEFPLRPQGQPWPGLNTRGGRLDPGQGQLEDGSFNAIINESDILQKRKGFVRGLDERFDGPVCGLFSYTGNCGIEYLLVADQDGVKVRTPFDVPTFLGSDSLPNDDFNELNTTRWTNTDDYQSFLGALQLTDLANSAATGGVVEESRLMQWFKPSAIESYQVEIQYNLEAAGDQVAAVVIKRDTDNYLVTNVYIRPAGYTFNMQLVTSGVRRTLDSDALAGASIADGFLRLSYDAETRIVTARAIPTGGSQVTLTKTLTEAESNNLGQNSAIGLARAEATEQPEILQVIGGVLGS
ncbi:MAG: hypothetical protein GY906_23505 [bacterium]|nr:hypothetical protein [bacterium]